MKYRHSIKDQKKKFRQIVEREFGPTKFKVCMGYFRYKDTEFDCTVVVSANPYLQDSMMIEPNFSWLIGPGESGLVLNAYHVPVQIIDVVDGSPIVALKFGE